MRKRQRTILSSVTVEGAGLHTGTPSSLTFHPAPEHHGIVFSRTDLEGSPTVNADVAAVSDTRRGTFLTGDSGVTIKTVEHVMSALAGLEVDNCLIELSAEEPPSGDGSANMFVEALNSVGFEDQNAGRNYVAVEEPITIKLPDGKTEYTLLPSDTFSATVFVDYTDPGLDSQTYSFSSLSTDYATEVAPARTFCFLSEVGDLRGLGLIKGGHLENAVVIVDHEYNVARTRELIYELELDVDPNGDLEGRQVLIGDAFRFENEPARHKMLDLMGDLALVGAPIQGHLIATRPGHTGNVELAREIRRVAEAKGLKRRFPLGDDAEPVMDINAVMDVLPHRYPFLLVDKVIDIDEKEGKIVGLKKVTFNEPFFQGHFPGFPIMPGVLIVEAMAQTGGMLLSREIGSGERKIAVFMGIKDAKFRKPVVPGDSLTLELTLKGKRFNTYTMAGKASVAGKVVAEAEISVAVINRDPS